MVDNPSAYCVRVQDCFNRDHAKIVLKECGLVPTDRGEWTSISWMAPYGIELLKDLDYMKLKEVDKGTYVVEVYSEVNLVDCAVQIVRCLPWQFRVDGNSVTVETYTGSIPSLRTIAEKRPENFSEEDYDEDGNVEMHALCERERTHHHCEADMILSATAEEIRSPLSYFAKYQDHIERPIHYDMECLVDWLIEFEGYLGCDHLESLIVSREERIQFIDEVKKVNSVHATEAIKEKFPLIFHNLE